MNDILANIIDTTSPQFSKDVTDGTAKQILTYGPSYLDEIFRSSIKSLSPNIPLTYEGFERMSPEEEFKELILSKNSKTVYDIAISDLYVIKYIFTYNGERIEQPIYMPYADKGNLIRISNTYYNLIPVLSDTVISPSHKEVFVRLLKNKLIFKSIAVNIIVDGVKKPVGRIIHVNIIDTKKIVASSNLEKGVVTPIALYILGKYGLREAMRRYAKTEDYIVTTDDVSKYRATHTVYEIPRVRSKDAIYANNDIKFCISKEVKLTPFLENFICGFLYVFQVLPDAIDDFITTYRDNILEDEILHWRILLGKIIYKNIFSMDRIIQDMTDHFDMLEGYLDNLIKNKLLENNTKVDNFFDLLYVIMEHYQTWLMINKEYNSDINNRYIDMLYYIFYDVIYGFNTAILAINKRASKNKNKNEILGIKEIRKILTSNIKARLIYGLVKSSTMKLCVQLTETTSDIRYPKITAILEDQSRGNGVKRGSKTQFPQSTKTLKGYDIYMGSMLFLSKPAPTPRFRSNLYLKYSVSTGKLIIPDDINKSITKLDDMLKGRLNNDKIEILDSETDEDLVKMR